jgi:hypothetical protein
MLASDTGQKKVFTGAIDDDGVYIFVHFQRLQALRPILSPLPPLPKHENKTKGHGTYHLHENDFVVGLYPWNTDFITIAVPKRAEYFTECSLRQKDMRLFQVLEIEVLPRSGNHESEEEN